MVSSTIDWTYIGLTTIDIWFTFCNTFNVAHAGMTIEMSAEDKESKENVGVLDMKPILALRNSKPYNCLEVYEKVRSLIHHSIIDV